MALEPWVTSASTTEKKPFPIPIIGPELDVRRYPYKKIRGRERQETYPQRDDYPVGTTG